MSRWVTAAVAVVALGVMGSCTEDDPARPSADAPRERGQKAGGPAAKAVKDDAQRTAGDRSRRKDRGQRSRPEPEPAPAPPPRTYLVTRIVDGDTLGLGSGEVVRVVGIDAPEVGECGYDRAAANLSYLTLGKQVTLTVSDEDRDQYGRLLRYVDVGQLDAGLRLIQNGLAVARYDSRDGYGFHRREPRYVAADRANPDVGCAAPQPLAAVPAQGGACAPGYTPCTPVFPPDVDCADVDGPIRVTGPDPHGLDADGDGTACE